MRARVVSGVGAAVQTVIALGIGVPLFFLYRIARRIVGTGRSRPRGARRSREPVRPS